MLVTLPKRTNVLEDVAISYRRAVRQASRTHCLDIFGNTGYSPVVARVVCVVQYFKVTFKVPLVINLRFRMLISSAGI